MSRDIVFSYMSALSLHLGLLTQASKTESAGPPIWLPALQVMLAPRNNSESTQVTILFTQLLLMQIQSKAIITQ